MSEITVTLDKMTKYLNSKFRETLQDKKRPCSCSELWIKMSTKCKWNCVLSRKQAIHVVWFEWHRVSFVLLNHINGWQRHILFLWSAESIIFVQHPSYFYSFPVFRYNNGNDANLPCVGQTALEITTIGVTFGRLGAFLHYESKRKQESELVVFCF